jgi:hypothetical protein
MGGQDEDRPQAGNGILIQTERKIMKLRTITVQISEELFAFACVQAYDRSLFWPEEYLTGLLNMALLAAINEREDCPLPPLPAADTRPAFLDEFEEDPGGGLRLRGGAMDDDLDDGIPF